MNNELNDLKYEEFEDAHFEPDEYFDSNWDTLTETPSASLERNSKHLDDTAVGDPEKTDEFRLETSDHLGDLGTHSNRYELLGADQIARLPIAKWRVKNILPSTGLAAIYGPSQSGKSFLAIDLAAAIAEGEPWFGNKTTASPVVYLMLEGHGALGKRKLAWEKRHERSLPNGFKAVLDPFCITQPKDLEDLSAKIPPGATIFIDTLNRAAPNSDENTSNGMGNILKGAEFLQKNAKGLVVIVHHTGKDLSKPMRGHSSLFAAMDAAIQVVKTSNEQYWELEKSKDSENGKQFFFNLLVHSLGVDADGDEITSCSVTWDQGRRLASPEPSGKNQKLAFKAVKTELSKAKIQGNASGASQSQSAKFDDLIEPISSRLQGVLQNKRNNVAKKLLSGLIKSGYLHSVEDADHETWVSITK
jgi:hypothetical protein